MLDIVHFHLSVAYANKTGISGNHRSKDKNLDHPNRVLPCIRGTVIGILVRIMSCDVKEVQKIVQLVKSAKSRSSCGNRSVFGPI